MQSPGLAQSRWKCIPPPPSPTWKLANWGCWSEWENGIPELCADLPIGRRLLGIFDSPHSQGQGSPVRCWNAEALAGLGMEKLWIRLLPGMDEWTQKVDVVY